MIKSGEFINFKIIPNAKPKGNILNVAGIPKAKATNLCANSCNTTAGAAIKQEYLNVCRLNAGLITLYKVLGCGIKPEKM